MPSAIVVGGGLAGLSAAHTILEGGFDVTLLDKNQFMGGNSTKATSGMNGAGTRTQAKMGVPDTKEIFEEDTIRGATGIKTGPCPPSYPLGRVLTWESADCIHWVQDRFGLALDTVSRLGGHSQPRTHRSTSGGKFPGMEITYALMQKFEQLCEAEPSKYNFIPKGRVVQLLKGAKGEITGVVYEKDGKQQSLSADVVVIASGGFGAGGLTPGSMLDKIRPELMHLPTTNGAHCTGDGISFAMDLGANAVDLKHVQVHPTGLVHEDDPYNRTKFLAAEALRGEGGIILDRDGNRFCNDIDTRDYVTMSRWKHNKAPYCLILNSSASSGIAWHCKHYTGRRVMKTYKSGAELAAAMGIPTAQLQASFDEYNAAASGKTQDKFGKKYFDSAPYNVTDSFHGAIITPVVHYTMGGLNIDEKARCILQKNSRPIPGLYAAGEVTGGVHGRNRLGGSALLECVVFGRVAGRNAVEYLQAGGAASLKPAGGAPAVLITVPQANGAEPITISVGGSASTGDESGPPAQDFTFEGEVSTLPPDTDAAKYPSTGKPQPGAAPAAAAAAAAPAGPAKKGDYTLEEVAKHTSENDCWVVVNGQVLDVTSFLDDHPGGKMAIMTFAGRDATEEFNMVHDDGVVEKYAAQCIVGNLKPSSKL
jgi:flavocytochrome c